ncbi:MAG: HAD-IC family P-type ATPase, partial [Clostridia bacterium]|nr:HAD-IC family P-type ATPase [Clostridia bacterium]
MKSNLNNSERLSKEEKSHRKFLELFPKMKKKKTSSVDTSNIQRFNATANEGLTTAQVDERINQGLVNKTTKKQSKTYPGIIFGNIFTGFNILCAIAAAALILAKAPLSQYLFVIIFVVNTVVAIFLEIRAKQKLDKLSILSSPTAKVMRNGKRTEIPVEELVIDDILLLSAGQQVPADCIAVEGMAELNESLLTGESVPIKKEDGDFIYAGSFVASGKIAVRVEKVSDATYVSQLTSKAKKYKRPNSEIMNSITLFIKAIGIAIVPVAILMFITNFNAQQNMAWADLAASGGFWNN